MRGDEYLPDRATGDRYRGVDQPGMSCLPFGTDVRIDLHFIDLIIHPHGDVLTDWIIDAKTWDFTMQRRL